MTSLKFWQFDIKAFFRAPQWEVAIVAKIFMAIFGAYLFLSVMAIGVGAYYVLQKEFPNEPTIDLINKGVFFIFFIADFIWGGKAGLFSLAFFGGLGIVFKHYILNHLAKIYTLGKHKTIAAFTKN